ncbi:MAG: chemotaxis protein CheD [Phycisphaerales bacterium]|nr:chemotaxis protein CheD [Phycisphaerales bacterium]
MSEMHHIGIAGMLVVKSPDRVRTTLGSCIGIALCDRVAKVGALGHVMLPSSQGCKGDKGKFADTAVDALVDDIVKNGAVRGRLTAKLAGGASMFGPTLDNGLGERNVQAVREKLAAHAIRVAADHVGGQKGRKMMLDPGNGEVVVQIIGEEPIVI